MFGALSNLSSLMKQAREMGARMEALQADLKQQRTVGAAGGGLVEIEMNGLQEALACRIDPKLLEQPDRELIEDLVRGAVNQAVGKAKQLHADALKSLTGGMELPSGIHEALGKLAGGDKDVP